jgi:hypothetical protein
MSFTPQTYSAHSPFSVAVIATLALSSGLSRAQTSDTVFTPLPPCRVVDSRINLGTSGLLLPGQVRTILFRGSCGIPGLTTDGGRETNQARALALNVIAVSAAGDGHLSAWPSNQSQPSASLINYSAVQNIANGVIVPMCDQHSTNPCAAGDIHFQAAVSSVHLVVDVTGYYSKPTLPGSVRHGAGVGVDNFLCLANGIRFGLTSKFATWANAGMACPAGSRLCESSEIAAACDTSRVDDTCDGIDCGFQCVDAPAGNHRGWTATTSTTGDATGILVGEDGLLFPGFVCEQRPVWCCSPD